MLKFPYSASWIENPCGFVHGGSLESELPRWIVGEGALSHRAIGRPFPQQIVELDGTDAVVERQMRKVAVPD
jgi:hypothetical protein